MSRAKETFESAIRDAEDLLAHFDSINRQPPPGNAEVLKRAGLIMALTAWETYVEDRIRDAVHRAKPSQSTTPPPHLVRRDDLDKAIRFLKSLVDATDSALVTQ